MIKIFLNFRWRLNVLMSLILRMSYGSEFQAVRPVTENARSPSLAYASVLVCLSVGLNVYSMLKHETLVLTVAAVERIEERLLSHVHSINHRGLPFAVEKLRYF